jgi:hypothetical protein
MPAELKKSYEKMMTLAVICKKKLSFFVNAY